MEQRVLSASFIRACFVLAASSRVLRHAHAAIQVSHRHGQRNIVMSCTTRNDHDSLNALCACFFFFVTYFSRRRPPPYLVVVCLGVVFQVFDFTQDTPSVQVS